MTSLALAACLIATSPTLRGAARDAELTEPGPHPVSVRVAGRTIFALQWRQPIVRTGVYRSVVESFGAPAVAPRHGRLFVGTGEGELLALALEDGGELWRVSHGVPFETQPVIVADPAGHERVVLASRDGALLAFSVDAGELAWKTHVEGDVRAPPTLHRGHLFVTTSTNKVVCLDAATGSVVWTQQRPLATALTIEGHARAVIAGDHVYVTFSDGYAMALSATQGDIVWSRPLSLRGGEFVDADADPFVADGKLFVASYSDGIYALDLKDGQTLWNRFAPAVTSLAEHADLVLVGSADGWVWGLHKADGALAHRTKVEQGPISRMAVRDGLVAFTAGPNGLVVLAAQSGKPLQATALGGRTVADPVWVDDTLAFVGNAGSLYVFSYVKGAPGRM